MPDAAHVQHQHKPSFGPEHACCSLNKLSTEGMHSVNWVLVWLITYRDGRVRVIPVLVAKELYDPLSTMSAEQEGEEYQEYLSASQNLCIGKRTLTRSRLMVSTPHAGHWPPVHTARTTHPQTHELNAALTGLSSPACH